MPNIDLSILNQRQTPAFYADVFANRPAPSFVGRIFISTDTLDLYRDTGTAWLLLSPSSTGTITGSGAAGQVTYFSAASSITGSNDLFWDSVNGHLGIGTNVPGTALQIDHDQSQLIRLNQTTATNDTKIAFQNSGVALWRIGNSYNAGANDFVIFDVVGAAQPFTIKKTTGQTFIGAETTSSGRLVVNNATGDNHIVVLGANSPSIRVRNNGSTPFYQFGLGLSTTLNNFIQGSFIGDFCIFNNSLIGTKQILFGIYNSGSGNTEEAVRIAQSKNFLIGTTTDSGEKLQVNGVSRFRDQIILDAASGNYPLINFNINNVNKWQLVTDPTNDDLVINQGTNRFYFLQNGNSTFGTNVYGAPRSFKFSVIDNLSNQYTTSSQQVVSRLFNLTQTTSSQNTSCCLSFQVSPDGSSSNPIATIGVVSESYGTNDGSFIVCTRSGVGIIEKLRLKSTGVLNLASVPTSSAGLVSGDIYSSAGVLMIVP